MKTQDSRLKTLDSRSEVQIMLCLASCVLCLSYAAAASAQVTFTDVTEHTGITPSGFSYIVCGDYDNDGYLDMLISVFGRRLYHNEGDGSFRDVAEESGAYGSGRTGAYFLDFDNDGYLDVFMSGNKSSEHGDRLLRNRGDGTFADVSQQAGLDPNARIQAYTNMDACSFDYDNDGLLDIFVVNGDCIPPIPNYLYHNEGNGHFRDAAAEIGLDDFHIEGVVPGDYDNDGDLDIFMTVRDTVDRLYRNDGNGIYTDVAKQAGVARNAQHLSGMFWDYDNDGDLDLFLRALQYGDISGFNVFYRNNGDGTFIDIAPQAGILAIENDAFSTDYGDYDNDGWLDLCVTYSGGSIVLYHNNMDGTFTNMSAEVGISSQIRGYPAGIFVDYNNDGYLDLLVAGETLLYQNDGNGNHWLQLKLVGRQSNRDAIGARIKVIAGELSMIREIGGASHHLHQDRIPVHFGLGPNQKADLMEIRWPSGIVQTFTNIPGNQRLTIDEFDGIITVLHEVIPGSGAPSGGTPIRIQGESFTTGSKVLFGGTEAVNVEVQTPTLITAVTPRGSIGLADVEVISPDGKVSVLKNGFRYSSIQITKLTPESGPTAGGIQVQIEGSGFQKGAVARVGENTLEDALVTPVLIQGSLPASEPGKVDVSVINPDGDMAVLKRKFTYISPPVAERVNLKFGPFRSSHNIQVLGSGFMKNPIVHVGGIAAQRVDFVSSSTLEVTLPLISEVGAQDVLVINPDGQRTLLPDALTILAPPKIRSVEPTTGSLEGGTEITITGEPTVEIMNRSYPSRFVGHLEVFIGAVEALDVVVQSDHVMTAIAPPNTKGLKDITIVDQVGQDDTLKDAFTYITAPQINRIIPDNGRLAGGTEITIQGSGFLPGARVLLSTDTETLKAASSSQVVSSTTITAITTADKPGARDVVVRNPDRQEAILPEGFTYNPMPTIISITPNNGISSGGTKVIIEGTGFLQRALVMVGERGATTMVRDDMTIEAVTPANRPGVWDVRVVNPDTQEAIAREGFVSVGELAYNFPNPFRASQGTTFRYVTDKPVQYINVKIFNMAGVPIDVIQQTDSNEVKWHNTEVHAGLYVYMMEIRLEDGNVRQFRNTLEVYK